MARLCCASALVRKARVTKLPSASCRRCPQHPSDFVTVRTGFDTERNVSYRGFGHVSSQFAVSGLSAVHGAAQKLKTR